MTTPVEQQLREYFTTVDRLRSNEGGVEPIMLRLVDDQSAPPSEGDQLMLTPNTQRQSNTGKLVMVAAAALIGLVAGLVVANAWNDDAPAPADEPTASLPDAAGSEVADLGFAGSTVDAGRYGTFLMGVPLELSLDGEWLLDDARASFVALHHPATTPADDVEDLRWIHLTRLAGWNAPEEAIDPDFQAEGSIDAPDIDRWIAENEVVASNRREIEVDGRFATAVDVVVDPAATGAPIDFARDPHNSVNDSCTERTAPCLWYRSIPDESAIGGTPRPDPVMHTDQTRRMWLIEAGASEAILIEAVVPDGDEAWLDEFERTTIATLEFGDDAPPAE